MNRRAPNTRKASKETSDVVLRPAIVRTIDGRISAKGVIELQCVPGLVEHYVKKLVDQWERLGKAFSAREVEELRGLLARGIEAGHRASPHAVITVEYETRPFPQPGIVYRVHTKVMTTTELYDQWVGERAPPLFGEHPDSKLMNLAAELGEPKFAPVLDIGAGTGRNAIPMARLGHPTTAVEMVPALAREMQKAASSADVSLEVIEGDIRSDDLTLSPARYKLIVMSEVATHFRHLDDLRQVFRRFAECVMPGGLVLMNAFLAGGGYKPDDVARDAAQVALSCVFTRAELEFITAELPFDRVSDESACEYERAHLPPEAWPPTGWFVNWAAWRNVADLPPDKIPVELRWLVYRRR